MNTPVQPVLTPAAKKINYVQEILPQNCFMRFKPINTSDTESVYDLSDGAPMKKNEKKRMKRKRKQESSISENAIDQYLQTMREKHGGSGSSYDNHQVLNISERTANCSSIGCENCDELIIDVAKEYGDFMVPRCDAVDAADVDMHIFHDEGKESAIGNDKNCQDTNCIDEEENNGDPDRNGDDAFEIDAHISNDEVKENSIGHDMSRQDKNCNGFIIEEAEDEDSVYEGSDEYDYGEEDDTFITNDDDESGPTARDIERKREGNAIRADAIEQFAEIDSDVSGGDADDHHDRLPQLCLLPTIR